MGHKFYETAKGAPAPWLLFLVILLAVILPRICGMGNFIHMDEGYHAFIAQYAWHSHVSGQGFPPEMSGFKLYPLIFAWVWALPGNAVVWFRIIDMLLAACAGWVFCVMLARESRKAYLGLLLGFAFLMGINAAGAIDSGFKNSFSPAFICLFCAVNLARDARPRSKNWIFAGCLTAIAILFRETFAPFVILACVSILFTRDYSALWRYMAGGIAAALAVTLVSAVARGQGAGLFEWYFTYGKIYGPEAGRRLHKFFSNGLQALFTYWPLLMAFLFALAALARKSGRQFSGRAWFWLAAAALPLIEPFSKIGFLYHFSVCLPGMAGFCAYAFGRLSVNAMSVSRGAFLVSALSACLMLPLWLPHLERAPVTLETFRNYPASGWPQSLADKSTTLEAVEAIRKLANPGDTVSSSGFAYFIFPASGMLPPSLGLGDISRAYIYAGQDEEKFRETLDRNPPDIVLIGRAVWEHSAIFWREFKHIFDRHPGYEYAGSVEPNLAKNYGWLGYMIYKRKTGGNKFPGRCPMDAFL